MNNAYKYKDRPSFLPRTEVCVYACASTSAIMLYRIPLIYFLKLDLVEIVLNSIDIKLVCFVFKHQFYCHIVSKNVTSHSHFLKEILLKPELGTYT